MTNAQDMLRELNNHISINKSLQNIFTLVDRKLFTPSHAKHFSYGMDAIYMGNDRWLPSPVTVAKVIKYLEVKSSDNILEIGCSSGYTTAILANMCKDVYTIDCQQTILDEVQQNFTLLNLENVHTVLATCSKDWIPKVVFHKIVFSLSVKKVAKIYFDMLEDDGIIIVPLEMTENYQVLTKYRKKNGVILTESIEQCSFISMTDIVQSCDYHFENKWTLFIRNIRLSFHPYTRYNNKN